MGLDIYTHYCENIPFAREQEKLAEEAKKIHTDKFFAENGIKSWNEFPDRESPIAKKYWEEDKAVGAQFGIQDYQHESDQTIELPSPIDPGHLFKIGYFRSSYNGSGINGYLRDAFGEDLYSLFEIKDPEVDVIPDWAKAKQNTLALIQKWEDKIKADGASYVVETFYPNSLRPDDAPKNEQQALELFTKELTKGPQDYNYSNAMLQMFRKEPLKIVALIPGTGKYIFNEMPCFYAIMEQDVSWYINALKIVVETCDYVLNHKNPQAFYMVWSG